MKREDARLCLNRWSAHGCRLDQRGALGDRCDLADPVPDPACVATLTTHFERRHLQNRSGPYRGERLATGRFPGVWEFDAGSVKPWAEETREFVVPGTEEIEPCRRCSGRGNETCDRCEGQGRMTCWGCRGARSYRCDSCGGSGGSSCGPCDGRGIVTCSTCGGQGSIGYTDTYGHTPPCPGCGGKCRVACNYCGGSGGTSCGSCDGGGWRRCGTCGGNGVARCPDCKGQGRNACPRCEGARKIRNWQALVVRFEVQKDTLSKGGGEVPADLLARAQGATLAATAEPARETDDTSELASMRRILVARHGCSAGPEGGGKIRQQRFEGKQVPVWKVTLAHRAAPQMRGTAWIYGIERQVWSGDKLPRHVNDPRWLHFYLLAGFTFYCLLLRWINPASPWWQALLILGGITSATALIHLVVGRTLEYRGVPYSGSAWIHRSLGGLALALTLGLLVSVPYLFKRMDRSVAMLGRFGITVPLAIRDPEAAAKQYYREGLRLLRQKGKERVALRAFQRALDLAPDDYRPRYRLAWLYYRLREPYAALQQFNYVLQLAPRTPEAAEARKMIPRITLLLQQGTRRR